jgi:hypothetical protein
MDLLSARSTKVLDEAKCFFLQRVPDEASEALQ